MPMFRDLIADRAKEHRVPAREIVTTWFACGVFAFGFHGRSVSVGGN